MALCASVMTGIYASPVMAAELEVELDGQGIVTVGTDVTGTLTIAGSKIATALNGTVMNGQELNLGTGRLTVGNIGTYGGVTANAGFIANGGSYYAIRGTNNEYTMLANEKYFALGSGGLLMGPEGSNNYNTTKEKATFYVDNATGNVRTKGDVTTLNDDGTPNYTLNTIGANTAGIERDPVAETTTIEGDFVVNGKDNTFGSKNGSFTVNAEDGTFTAANGAFKVREGVGETVIAGSIISSKDQFGNQGTFNGSNLNLQSADHTRNTSIDAGTAYFVKDGSGTSIDGGAITAKSLLLGTKDVGATIAGIERETVTDEFGTVNTTTIEGALKVSDNGLISNADGSFTVDSNGGLVAGDGTFAADITGITMKAPVQMTLQGGYNYKGQTVIDLGTTISDIDDRLDVLEDKTQNIKPGTGTGTGTGAGTGEGGTAAGEGNNIIEVPATGEGHTGINGDVTVGGDITAGGGTIGDVTMSDGNINTDGVINAGGGTIGNATFDEDNTIFGTGDNQTTINNDGVTVGGENGTSITGEGITVGDKNGVSIKNDEVRVGGGEDGKGGSYMNDTDVVSGEGVSLNDTAERVGHLENRVGKLEDRIDKVGAMAAAIANLRTMGYDPAAPTEVAVGIGQYRDETGAALGLFHYPNRDFMLSLSVSTSGDEVMGGIGATWKFGRKSPEKVAEIKKAQAEADVRRAEEAKLAKAEEMKQAAKEAKIKAQQERHAKLAAERAAQAEAAK